MKERNNESLSALMDGEADELEVRRILNQLDSDDELRDKWKNYHLMGSLMRDESFDSVDLTQGINSALDGEMAPSAGNDSDVSERPAEVVANTAKTAWYKPLTSVAVAASVTLAVLLGVQSIETTDGVSVANNQQPARGELAASTLSLEEQKALEDAQQQLQEYVLKHPADDVNSTQKGVLPFARIVEFETQNK